MNKSKSKRNKKILHNIYNKSKSNIKKINKTMKNKETLNKCDNFCKKDYMVEMDKLFRKYNTNYSPTKVIETNSKIKTIVNDNKEEKKLK